MEAKNKSLEKVIIRWKEAEGKVFNTEMETMVSDVSNTVKAHPDYLELEDRNDVIELMKLVAKICKGDMGDNVRTMDPLITLLLLPPPLHYCYQYYHTTTTTLPLHYYYLLPTSLPFYCIVAV